MRSVPDRGGELELGSMGGGGGGARGFGMERGLSGGGESGGGAGGGGGGGGQKQGFDPVLIVYQMVAMQCFYYLGYGTLLGIMHVVFGTSVSMDHFFSDKYLVMSTSVGYLSCFLVLSSAVVGALLLYFVVEKSKKCVDFTFTLYGLHALFTWLMQGHAPSVVWWVLHTIAAIVMAALGEFLCAYYEMQDLPQLI